MCFVWFVFAFVSKSPHVIGYHFVFSGNQYWTGVNFTFMELCYESREAGEIWIY